MDVSHKKDKQPSTVKYSRALSLLHYNFYLSNVYVIMNAAAQQSVDKMFASLLPLHVYILIKFFFLLNKKICVTNTFNTNKNKYTPQNTDITQNIWLLVSAATKECCCAHGTARKEHFVRRHGRK